MQTGKRIKRIAPSDAVSSAYWRRGTSGECCVCAMAGNMFSAKAIEDVQTKGRGIQFRRSSDGFNVRDILIEAADGTLIRGYPPCQMADTTKHRPSSPFAHGPCFSIVVDLVQQSSTACSASGGPQTECRHSGGSHPGSPAREYGWHHLASTTRWICGWLRPDQRYEVHCSATGG